MRRMEFILFIMLQQIRKCSFFFPSEKNNLYFLIFFNFKCCQILFNSTCTRASFTSFPIAHAVYLRFRGEILLDGDGCHPNFPFGNLVKGCLIVQCGLGDILVIIRWLYKLKAWLGYNRDTIAFFLSKGGRGGGGGGGRGIDWPTHIPTFNIQEKTHSIYSCWLCYLLIRRVARVQKKIIT